MPNPKIEFAQGRFYDLPVASNVAWTEPYLVKKPPDIDCSMAMAKRPSDIDCFSGSAFKLDNGLECRAEIISHDKFSWGHIWGHIRGNIWGHIVTPGKINLACSRNGLFGWRKPVIDTRRPIPLFDDNMGSYTSSDYIIVGNVGDRGASPDVFTEMAYVDITSVSEEAEGKPDGVPDILFRTFSGKTYVFPGMKGKK